MRKCVNGEYMDMTEDEVDQIKMENQRQLLEDLQHDAVSNQDLIDIILGQYTVTLPDGSTHNATDVVGHDVDLPLKLGQKWELVLAGNAFMYQLVNDPDAIGTSDQNPIVYYDGVPLINNAFYKKDGVIQVYMNGEWVEWYVKQDAD